VIASHLRDLSSKPWLTSPAAQNAATRQIRKASPKTAVLIPSAYDDDRYAVGLLETTVVGVPGKP
jgi:DNA-binding NarL/FixJ family response regulator